MSINQRRTVCFVNNMFTYEIHFCLLCWKLMMKSEYDRVGSHHFFLNTWYILLYWKKKRGTAPFVQINNQLREIGISIITCRFLFNIMYSLIEAAPLKRIIKKKDKLLNAQRGMGQTFMSPLKSVYTFNAFSFPMERHVEPLLHLMSTQLSPELVNNYIKHFPCRTKNPVLIKEPYQHKTRLFVAYF